MKYILFSHGDYAAACLDSCQMIIGKTELFEPICFHDTMSKEDLLQCLEELFERFGCELAIVCDIVGGTPFNVALEFQAKHEGVRVCTGLSLGICILLGMELSLDEALEQTKDAMKLYPRKSDARGPVSVSAPQPKDLPTHVELDANANLRDLGICHIRVDERLIHGQVATMWTHYLHADRILIIDDEVVKDDIAKMALKTAVPKGVKLSILTPQGAIERIYAGQYVGQNVFVLVRRPHAIYELAERGLAIDFFNIGNCSSHDTTVKVKKSVYLYESEINELRELLAQGVTITAQMVPSDEAEVIENYLP